MDLNLAYIMSNFILSVIEGERQVFPSNLLRVRII